jgi:hypothetical protein
MLPVMSDDHWPEVGEFNTLEASVGARGMGKTTWQQHRVWQTQRETGAYVIGHSLGARLTRKLPQELGGATLPIRYHTTLKKLEHGLRRHPGDWHILAPPLLADGNNQTAGEAIATADELLKFSIKLSNAIRKWAWKKRHPFRFWGPNVDYKDIRCPPIIVMIDEGIAIESAGPSRKEDNRWFLQYLYSLRHMHIALFYAIQDGSARSWRVLEQATRIFVFAIRHEWALNAMRAAGASRDEIDEIRRLTKWHHVEIAALDVEKLEAESGVSLNEDGSGDEGGKMPGADEEAKSS